MTMKTIEAALGSTAHIHQEDIAEWLIACVHVYAASRPDAQVL